MQYYVYEKTGLAQCTPSGDTHGREVWALNRTLACGFLHFPMLMFVAVLIFLFFLFLVTGSLSLYMLWGAFKISFSYETFRSSRRVYNRKRRSVFHDFFIFLLYTLHPKKSFEKRLPRVSDEINNNEKKTRKAFHFMLRSDPRLHMKEIKYVTEGINIYYAIFCFIFCFKSIQH